MMKIITLNDCFELKEKFIKYTQNAEQHEFSKLFLLENMIDTTLEKYSNENKVSNQKDARAMFRVVLKTIGEDFSEYEEQNYEH